MPNSNREEKSIVNEFHKIVMNIEQYTKDRRSIIEKHFPELNLSLSPQTKSTETKIADMIGKRAPYPLVFLASTIGFSKSNMTKTVEKILSDLNLSTRLRYATFDNMKRYETLKLLILKYVDKKYRHKG